MAEVFFSRSLAAKHAQRKGWRAFRTEQPLPSDRTCWTVKEMPNGPGVEFAELFAAEHDYVAWVEITDLAIPVLVVSCFREEILDVIPPPLTLEPMTPELWAHNRAEYPAVRSTRRAKASGDTTATGPKPERVMSSVPGAVNICRTAFSIPGITRDEYMASVLGQGVGKATATTQWSRRPR